MELSELCKELNNWFDVKRYFGEFEISGGSIDLSDILSEDQYFRVVGSVFNDGVYKWSASSSNFPHDETFEGAIWAMAVPPAVIALLGEITEWGEKYSSAVNSPYQSESFGGYSYSKASGQSGSGNPLSGYKMVFADKLSKWRKV